MDHENTEYKCPKCGGRWFGHERPNACPWCLRDDQLASRDRTIEVLWGCIEKYTHEEQHKTVEEWDAFDEAVHTRNADALAKALGIKEGS